MTKKPKIEKKKKTRMEILKGFHLPSFRGSVKAKYHNEREERKKELEELCKKKDFIRIDSFTPIKNPITLTKTEYKITNVKTETDKLEEEEKNNIIAETVNESDSPLNEDNDPTAQPLKSDDVEKAVAVSIRTLSNPENIKHFSRLTTSQISHMALGYTLFKNLNYVNPSQIFDEILDMAVSKNGKGREEMEKIGVAGVNREKDSGILDKLRNGLRRD